MTTRRPRPTHFIAVSLHTNPALRTRIAAFQSSLHAASPPIRGLDPSITIEPIRFHLTLGVMALSKEPTSPEMTVSPDTRTVSTALALLRSLKPRLDAILDSDGGEHADHAGLQVVLDALDIMRPVSAAGASDDVWADVLYLAPRETGVDGVKLRKIADCVERTFKKAGYVTETRPLKLDTYLHCTVLNTSKRRPARARGQHFCYSDILRALAPATTPTLHPPAYFAVPAPAPASTTITTADTTTATKTLPPPPAPVPLTRALALALDLRWRRRFWCTSSRSGLWAAARRTGRMSAAGVCRWVVEVCGGS
ncbi:hypothetical protein D9615_008780 [Tricholomella constricta]|uniref:A-kinase anchor protein 7-like phosphoesterase domain-containing protein n=1 Tax=Tricholomella constricta TaxID=117010 RepID=A0A8H5H7V3_9AGAR|nr:hypothetical protein D9615_008780 [Tricholomella constricta]